MQQHIYIFLSSLWDNATGICVLLHCFDLADYIYVLYSVTLLYSSLNWRIKHLFSGHTCSSQINILRGRTTHFYIYPTSRLSLEVQSQWDVIDVMQSSPCLLTQQCVQHHIYIHASTTCPISVSDFSLCDHIWWWLLSVNIEIRNFHQN